MLVTKRYIIIKPDLPICLLSEQRGLFQNRLLPRANTAALHMKMPPEGGILELDPNLVYSAASATGVGGVHLSTGLRAARVSSRRRRGAW